MTALAGRGLDRSFGGVRAVAGVDVALAPGEMVAVVGPNGSGKSTLIDLLTGIVALDGGAVSVGARPIHPLTAAAVARRGVRRTFQNGRLIESLSARDNVRLGLHLGDPTRRFALGSPTRSRSARALDDLGAGHLGDRPVAELSVGERRRVELARALVGHPGALVLDEPTAGLPRSDAGSVVGLLRSVAERAVGVLMIEHDIDVVRACADRVIVMVDGRVRAEGAASVLDDAEVRAILGHGLPPLTSSRPAPGPTLLAAGALGARRGRDDVLAGVDLELRSGEVVALLGANGSGKTTLLAALSGLLDVQRGRIHIGDRDITGWAPERIARHRVAHLPQRRHLFGSMTVLENLAVSDAAMGREGTPIPTTEILERFPELAARLRVPVNRLSGGEQQLVMLARGLRARPRVILADEPTAALSPGTRRRVLAWLRELADEGAAVLLAEQHAAEAMAIADRTLTMRQGCLEPLGTASDP
ncbi:MAG: ATP-binding cassette domain-containing protein [Candidatus Dormibacteria bacterium]